MLALIVRRLAVGVLIVWLVSILVFLVTMLLPGDAAQTILGRQANPTALALLQKQMHLNDPAIVQYGRWLGDMVTGHWGKSLVSQDSVSSLVLTAAENTGLVMLVTTLIATPLALIVGVAGALRSEGALDHVLSVATLILVALPAFVIAVSLIFLLATTVTCPPGSLGHRPIRIAAVAVETTRLAGPHSRPRCRFLSHSDDPGQHG